MTKSADERFEEWQDRTRRCRKGGYTLRGAYLAGHAARDEEFDALATRHGKLCAELRAWYHGKRGNVLEIVKRYE